VDRFGASQTWDDRISEARVETLAQYLFQAQRCSTWNCTAWISDARVIAFMGLGSLNRLVGFDLGHLLCNAALGFQRVIGVLEPQEIAFRQAEKLA